MQPSPAEVARTLAAGHLPAVAYVACRPGPFPVRHVSDDHGRLLLLSPAGGALDTALRPADGATDTAMVLDISDVPPTADSPSLGRVWVSGWVRRLDGPSAREAALEYAAVDPSGDLLDVGDGQTMHRMEVAEVRYERHGTLVDIDPDEYAEATPDPLRRMEYDLIADLTDHHRAELGAYIRRRLGPAAQPPAQPVAQPVAEPAARLAAEPLADPAARPDGEPTVVRLDRYGFVVRVGDRLARLAFSRPVADRHDLAHLLHPVLCHRCSSR